MDPGPSAILQLLDQELPPSLHAPYVTHSLCRQVTIPAATVGRNEDGGGKRKEGKVSDEWGRERRFGLETFEHDTPH